MNIVNESVRICRQCSHKSSLSCSARDVKFDCRNKWQLFGVITHGYPNDWAVFDQMITTPSFNLFAKAFPFQSARWQCTSFWNNQ